MLAFSKMANYNWQSMRTKSELQKALHVPTRNSGKGACKQLHVTGRSCLLHRMNVLTGHKALCINALRGLEIAFDASESGCCTTLS